MKLLAFGTVAGGFLSEKWLGKPEPVLNESLTWSQMKYKRFIDAAGGWEIFQNLLQTLQPIAQKHGVSIAALASHYMLCQPAVAGVIIGARLGQSQHVAENELLFSIQLDAADQSKIQNALSSLQTVSYTHLTLPTSDLV